MVEFQKEGTVDVVLNSWLETADDVSFFLDEEFFP